jgi:hypothetical protein
MNNSKLVHTDLSRGVLGQDFRDLQDSKGTKISLSKEEGRVKTLLETFLKNSKNSLVDRAEVGKLEEKEQQLKQKERIYWLQWR